MAGSGAGSNLVSAYILTNVTAPTAVAINAAGQTTAYGTIGFNDSGGWLGEARAYTKWTFELEQVGTVALSGFSVSIYGTTSPAAEQTWWNAIYGGAYSGSPSAIAQPGGIALPINGITNATGYVPGVASLNWRLLPGQTDQGGTGLIANPLVAGQTSLLVVSMRLSMIRAVVTQSAAPTGTFNLVASAVP
jgi:hypothetical protein